MGQRGKATNRKRTTGRGSPRAVTRGAQPQPGAASPDIQGVEIGIDWLRVVGSKDQELRALRWMIARFGEAFEVRKGINFHRERFVWSCGAEMWVGHVGTDGCVIELRGEIIGAQDGETRVRWLRSLAEAGFRCTRLDIAIDQRDPRGRLTLVSDARAACEAGQLCRFRVWDLYQRTARGALAGYTVYLGKRGSEGGGRVVRIYDKGLEQAGQGRGRWRAGQWHRWETEFSGEHAARVFGAIAEDERSVSEIALGAHALGVADFCEVNGRREIARRPRLAWFARLVEIVGDLARVSVPRKAARLASMVGWLRRCVLPTLRGMADETGYTVDQIIAEFSRGVDPGGSETVRLGWRQFVAGLAPSASMGPRLGALIQEGALHG